MNVEAFNKLLEQRKREEDDRELQREMNAIRAEKKLKIRQTDEFKKIYSKAIHLSGGKQVRTGMRGQIRGIILDCLVDGKEVDFEKIKQGVQIANEIHEKRKKKFAKKK